MKDSIRLSIAALILAIGMIISASLLSKFFVRVRHEQTIEVKGYAEQDVVSDVGRFSCMFRARGASLAEAYDQLQQSRTRVLIYLAEAGFGPAQIASETIQTDKISKRDEQGKETNEIEYYDASQSITITDTNVVRIRDAATSITELIRDGIDIRAFTPEFTISVLGETKLDLLARATENGYQRAQALAKNSNGHVGALLSAQQGVFQITARNSTDTAGYGVYDTSTIEKTAKAVVTLGYAIETGAAK